VESDGRPPLCPQWKALLRSHCCLEKVSLCLSPLLFLCAPLCFSVKRKTSCLSLLFAATLGRKERRKEEGPQERREEWPLLVSQRKMTPAISCCCTSAFIPLMRKEKKQILRKREYEEHSLSLPLFALSLFLFLHLSIHMLNGGRRKEATSLLTLCPLTTIGRCVSSLSLLPTCLSPLFLRHATCCTEFGRANSTTHTHPSDSCCCHEENNRGRRKEEENICLLCAASCAAEHTEEGR